MPLWFQFECLKHSSYIQSVSVGQVSVGVVVDDLDVLAGDDEGVVVVLVVYHDIPLRSPGLAVLHHHVDVDLPALAPADLVAVLSLTRLAQRHLHIALTLDLKTTTFHLK